MPDVRPHRVRGLYEDEFWSYIARDELRLQQDPATGTMRFPPSPVAPGTLGTEAAWVPLDGSGVLVAWTVFRRAYFPDIPVPYTVAVVRSLEGPLFVSHLPGDRSASLTHGMPMRLVFEDIIQAGSTARIFNWVPISEPPEVINKESEK